MIQRLATWAGDWLEERAPWKGAVEFLRKKPVPLGKHTPLYYLGGMSLFCFIVQVVTGTFLLVYYKPSAEQAFESVKFITVDVPFGWLIRSIHSWSANVMVGLVMAHMFSVFLTKSYRRPRELTWLTGMGLLGITMTFGFSGYLLPWNQLAYFATKVGTDTMKVVPIVGDMMTIMLRGGEDVSEATLNRFFALHVMVLPMAGAAILGLHLFLVQVHGMSLPIESPKKTGTRNEYMSPFSSMPFYPDFMLRDLIGWLLILGLLATLAVYRPWELGVKADPFASAPAGIRPEWFFVFIFETLKIFPAKIMGIEGEFLVIMGSGVAGMLWAISPFLDRKAQRGLPSPMFTAAGVIIILYILIMTVYSYAQTGAH